MVQHTECTVDSLQKHSQVYCIHTVLYIIQPKADILIRQNYLFWDSILRYLLYSKGQKTNHCCHLSPYSDVCLRSDTISPKLTAHKFIYFFRQVWYFITMGDICFIKYDLHKFLFIYQCVQFLCCFIHISKVQNMCTHHSMRIQYFLIFYLFFHK